MRQRGRKSAASLSVVATMPGQRPEPPRELTKAQAAIWRSVVATKPADWFTEDTHPLLMAYCRHAVAAEALAREIDMIDFDGDDDQDRYKKMIIFEKLQIMRERETKMLISLARSMRLTHQARYKSEVAHTKAASVGAARKPWEAAE